MSSIYRKGRDGYYYYQTYVYDKDTGKKNKRIFHSLGTKNEEEAKKKQIHYDEKYTSSEKSDTKKNIFINLRFFLFVIVLLIMSMFFLKISNLKDKSEKRILINDNVGVEQIDTIKMNAHIDNFQDSIKQNKGTIDTNSGKTIIEIESKTEILKIPPYKIERVENLSSLFKQKKLYVTIEENISSDRQLLLCNDLKNKYPDTNNLVICLYSNLKSCSSLVNGLSESINYEEKKKCWLAMYTYNPVEGEYFDSNPSNYLGFN